MWYVLYSTNIPHFSTNTQYGDISSKRGRDTKKKLLNTKKCKEKIIKNHIPVF